MDEESQRKAERELAQGEAAAQNPTPTTEPHPAEAKPTQSPDPSVDAPSLQAKDTGEAGAEQTPQGEHEHDDKGKTKDVAQTEEPQLTGPGPRPLGQVVREHGAAPAGKEHADNPGEQGKEHSEGEHYVHTTGLAADGGDFDASKPGAGREAERLMEEKGMRRAEEEAARANQGGSSGHKDKPSLGERIKHKLHKHN